MSNGFEKRKGNQQYISDYKMENYDVCNNIEDNVQILQTEYFQNVDDLNIRRLFHSVDEQVVSAVAYIQNLVKQSNIDEVISDVLPKYISENVTPKKMDTSSIQIGGFERTTSMKNVADALLEGKAILFFNGDFNAHLISANNIPQRSVEEPTSEATIHGPRDGFTEDIATNIGLIRKRIRSQLLKVKVLKMGSLTNTQVAVLYIDTLTNPEVIAEAMNRIQSIEIDSVISEQQLVEFLQDNPDSMFPLLDVSERPDRIVGNLLDGRICILLDGTPFAIYGPIDLMSLLQSPDDYYFSAYISTALRFLRILTLAISLLFPSLYISLTSFHHEMLPTPLALSIQQGREEVPFPSILEVMIMEIAFEILREAGIRLPKMLGPTVSIVGALIIGEAVVRAGIISPMMVIIVSVTAISSFAIPSYNLAISFRILRFIFIVLAGIFGLFGIIWGGVMLMIYLSRLRSLGIPYFAPFVSLDIRYWKHTIIRLPFRFMNTYPKHLVKDDLKKFVKPIRTMQKQKFPQKGDD